MKLMLQQLYERASKSVVFNKILKGGAWMAAGSIIAQILGLATSVLLARILGVEDFGRYGLLQNTLLSFGTLASRSMQVTATKFVAQYKSTDPVRAGRLAGLCWLSSVVSSALVFAVVFFGAEWLAAWANDVALEPLFKIAAFVILFSAVVAVQKGMILAIEKIRFLALTNVFVAVLNISLLPLLCIQYGLVGVVWAIVGITVVNWVVNSSLLRKALHNSPVVFTFRGISKEMEILWKFTLPRILMSLVNVPIGWVAIMLLASQSNGIAEVAVFAAIAKWRQFILFLPGMISKPSIPIISESFGMGNYKRVTKVLLSTLALNGVVCAALALGMALAAPWILQMYGDTFRMEGVFTMWVMMAAAFLQGMVVPIGDAVGMAGRNWIAFSVNLLRSGVMVGMAYAMVRHGSVGLAWAHLAASLTTFVSLSAMIVWIIKGKKAI